VAAVVLGEDREMVEASQTSSAKKMGEAVASRLQFTVADALAARGHDEGGSRGIYRRVWAWIHRLPPDFADIRRGV
jgi:hypothetical protein